MQSDDRTGQNEAQIHQALTDMIEKELVDLAAVFASHVPQEKLRDVAEHLATEQLEVMGKVLPVMINPKAGQPQLHVELHGYAGFQNAVFPALKRIEMAHGDPQLAITQAMLLAFLLCPAARGLLLLHGYKYRTLDPKPASRVTLT